MKIIILKQDDELTQIKIDGMFGSGYTLVSTKLFTQNKEMYLKAIKLAYEEEIFKNVNSFIYKAGILCIMCYGLSKLLGF